MFLQPSREEFQTWATNRREFLAMLEAGQLEAALHRFTLTDLFGGRSGEHEDLLAFVHGLDAAIKRDYRLTPFIAPSWFLKSLVERPELLKIAGNILHANMFRGLWPSLLDYFDVLNRAAEETRAVNKPKEDRIRRDAHLEKAHAHGLEGRLDDACYELERAKALDPSITPLFEEMRRRSDIERMRKVAERHASAGKTAEAIDVFERLLRLAPDDESAKARLAELRPASG